MGSLGGTKEEVRTAAERRMAETSCPPGDISHPSVFAIGRGLSRRYVQKPTAAHLCGLHSEALCTVWGRKKCCGGEENMGDGEAHEMAWKEAEHMIPVVSFSE
jgi:hypothetical protein